jgi:hypothetical protein
MLRIGLIALAEKRDKPNLDVLVSGAPRTRAGYSKEV